MAVREVLAEGRSQYQSYAVLDTVPFGRILVLDDVIQSADIDEFVYHESFVVPAMCALDRPRRVAILGGGEGAMARETLRHGSVESVTMVDIDEEVVAQCKAHLRSQHAGAFDDPRLTLIFADARAWLEAHDEQHFDVVLVDLTEPLAGGPSYRLFTKEFYELVKRRLAPGGVVALQGGSARHELVWAFARVVHTLQAVFPHVLPYVTHVTSFAEPWGFAIAGGDAVSQLTPALLDERLHARDITPRHLDGECFAGLVRLSKVVRDALAQEHTLVTDDDPLVFSRA